MLNILFVSDYVCPYCLVAKEALKQALAETGLEATIAWQPFELTVEPRERVDTYHDEVRKAKYQVLVEPCKQLGLDMKLPPKVVPRPYTRLAFEGWYYACSKGVGEAYNDLMYKAYFIDEQDIGEKSVLVRLAENIGLDSAEFEKALDDGTYSKKEKAAVEYAREVLQIGGVPTIYINEKKIGLQEFTKEEMIRILQEEDASAEAAGGMFCGADGCL